MGLQNAYHIACSCPHPQLLLALLKFKINPDVPDHKQVTPFNLTSLKTFPNEEHMHDTLTNHLLDLKVRYDFPDNKGRTPFLNYIADNRKPQYERMLGLGANVN